MNLTTPENYKKEELTIDAAKAQLGALVYGIPFILIFGVPYILLWMQNASLLKSFKQLVSGQSGWKLLVIVCIILVGIVIHELIHGLTWSKFAKDGLKSIRYGVLWKYLTPYCHCKEPLLVKHYIIGGIMPGIILGFIPSLISIITGSFSLFMFGLFFTIAAGGDFMIVNILRKEPMNSLVQDHPSKIGCFIFRLKNEKGEI